MFKDGAWCVSSSRLSCIVSGSLKSSESSFSASVLHEAAGVGRTTRPRQPEAAGGLTKAGWGSAADSPRYPGRRRGQGSEGGSAACFLRICVCLCVGLGSQRGRPGVVPLHPVDRLLCVFRLRLLYDQRSLQSAGLGGALAAPTLGVTGLAVFIFSVLWREVHL